MLYPLSYGGVLKQRDVNMRLTALVNRVPSEAEG
jgi:hypothetical protein